MMRKTFKFIAVFIIAVIFIVIIVRHNYKIVSIEETITEFGQTICLIETPKYSAALVETEDSEILVAWTRKGNSFCVSQAFVPLSEIPVDADNIWIVAFRYALFESKEVETFFFY